MAGRGRPGVAPQTAKREQYAALIARGVSQLGGVPDRRYQPPDGQTLATRAHDHQQRRAAAALCAGGRCCAQAGDLGTVPVRGRAGRIADLRRCRGGSAGDRPRGGPQSGDDQPGAAPQRRPGERRVPPVRGAAAGRAAPGTAEGGQARRATWSCAGSCRTGSSERWSPEQIATRCEPSSRTSPQRHVVHETIYQAVYRPDLGGLCRDLPKALRTGRRRRKPHRRADERRGRLVNMTMIDQRPAEAADRSVPGTGRAI